MIGGGHYEKRGQGSLRARKEALSKTYNEEEIPPVEKVVIKEVKEVKVKESDTSKFEDIVQQQLDLIKKQNEQIERLIHTIATGNGGVGRGSVVVENNKLVVEEPEDHLFIDDLIDTKDIKSSGSPEGIKTTGNSIEDKIKKLRELKK